MRLFRKTSSEWFELMLMTVAIVSTLSALACWPFILYLLAQAVLGELDFRTMMGRAFGVMVLSAAMVFLARWIQSEAEDIARKDGR